MQLTKEQLQEKEIGADNIKARKSDATDEEALKEQANVTDAGEVSDDEEYEYVPITEVSHGIAARVMGFLKEYSLIVLFVVIALVCFILSNLGSQMSAVFIAIAFGFIAIAVAYILYDAWQQKKAAEAAYLHARDVREPVKRKMMEDADQQK